MQHIQVRFLALAALAVIFMSLVGIMLAEKNMLLATLSAVASLAVVGYGFIQKSKQRKASSSQQ
ncbi:DUF5325 family protein [Priestia taiwanensis]|uniref:Uncharacterized protein n=1 Tax=Priestia taiwanensis TaxID=1347902 RepID=A0A917AQD9_9BACI|nr:DUF5325 family protein [Priestia taiwanensis]MBM7362992.1 hypothetical protein [Priestia taiwanensis]GGE66758.1 hypothetical protein GCM10007140_16150 [Priestia taiwanensis]